MNIDEVRETMRQFLLNNEIPSQDFRLGMVREDENGNFIQDIYITLPLPVHHIEIEVATTEENQDEA